MKEYLNRLRKFLSIIAWGLAALMGIMAAVASTMDLTATFDLILMGVFAVGGFFLWPRRSTVVTLSR